MPRAAQSIRHRPTIAMSVDSQPATALLRWHPLAPRARLAFALVGAFGAGLPLLVAGTIAGVAAWGASAPWLVLALAVALLAGAGAAGAALGVLRHRHTSYRLDDDGLRIRRGRWWQSETLVPRSRVQHLDLERGPIERRLNLATLVVHTAGTRSSAIKLAGLASADADALRDALVLRGSGDDAV